MSFKSIDSTVARVLMENKSPSGFIDQLAEDIKMVCKDHKNHYDHTIFHRLVALYKIYPKSAITYVKQYLDCSTEKVPMPVYLSLCNGECQPFIPISGAFEFWQIARHDPKLRASYFRASRQWLKVYAPPPKEKEDEEKYEDYEPEYIYAFLELVRKSGDKALIDHWSENLVYLGKTSPFQRELGRAILGISFNSRAADLDPLEAWTLDWLKGKNQLLPPAKLSAQDDYSAFTHFVDVLKYGSVSTENLKQIWKKLGLPKTDEKVNDGKDAIIVAEELRQRSEYAEADTLLAKAVNGGYKDSLPWQKADRYRSDSLCTTSGLDYSRDYTMPRTAYAVAIKNLPDKDRCAVKLAATFLYKKVTDCLQQTTYVSSHLFNYFLAIYNNEVKNAESTIAPYIEKLRQTNPTMYEDMIIELAILNHTRWYDEEFEQRRKNNLSHAVKLANRLKDASQSRK